MVRFQKAPKLGPPRDPEGSNRKKEFDFHSFFLIEDFGVTWGIVGATLGPPREPEGSNRKKEFDFHSFSLIEDLGIPW